MQSNAKIVLQVVTDAEEAKKQAKNIGKDVAKNVEKGANNIKFGDKIKGQLDKLKKGLDAVGVSAGGLSKIGNLFKGGGWIALATAAIAGIGNGILDLIDRFTVSADELINRGSSIAKNAKQELDKTLKDESSTTGYIQRLRQLNSIENKSNLEKMQAVAIIQELTKVYGELGLSISAATGNVLGLDKALKEIEKRNRQSKGKKAQDATRGAREKAQGTFRKYSNNQVGYDSDSFWDWSGGWKRMFRLDNTKRFNDFYKKFKSRDDVKKNGINAKMNENERGISSQEKELRKKWNKDYSGKIQYLKKHRDNAKTEDEIQAYDNLIQAIKELQKSQEEEANIKKYGFRTQKQYLDMLKQENSQIRKNREQAKKRAKEFAKQRSEREQKEFYASLTPASTKRAYQQVKLQQRQDELTPLRQKEKEIRYKIVYEEEQLQDAQRVGDITRIRDSYAKINKLMQELTKVEEEVRKKELSIADIKAQINRLTRQETEENLRKLKTDQQRIRKLRQMIELQKKKQADAKKRSERAGAEKEGDKTAVKILEGQKKGLERKRAVLGPKEYRQEYDLKGKIQHTREQMEKAFKSGDVTHYNIMVKNLKQYEEQLQVLQQKIKRGQFEYSPDLDSELQSIKQLNVQIADLEAEIARLKKDASAQDQKRAKAQKEALQAKMRQLQMQKQIEEMQKRAKDYYDDRKSDLDAEYAIQHALLKGMYDLAEQTKIINELKKQGIIVDQKQIDAIKQKQALLKGVSVDRSLKQQGYSILDKVGAKDKNYQYERRIRELEEANGVSLTQTQKDKVKTLVDLQFKLDDLQKIKPDFSELQIKTNELTARGGFAGGAVMPDIEAIDKQIMDYQARSTTLLNDIKNILRQGGII